MFKVRQELRIAFFPDSYTEVNGVALTSNKLTDFVRRKGFPFLCIYAGDKTELVQQNNFQELKLKRSPLSFALDEALSYDPFFNRHMSRVNRELVKFAPDVIHITGLNDVSIIGAYLAYKHQIPLLISWHTNLHEFAARRLDRMFGFLPNKTRTAISSFAERKILDGALLYYKMGKILLAPNKELVELLEKRTGRQGRLMARGVDTDFLTPAKRTANDGKIRIGFVGRLRAEKNVRLLADVEKALVAAGKTNVGFLIVGEGTERDWLEKNMKTAEFTGFLAGEELAEAYANMDIFLFPSETDAFGNVAQEACASGVPAIVSDKGGPKFIIEHEKSGFVAKTPEDYVKYCIDLIDNPEKLATMKVAARNFTQQRSWDSIFEKVYDAYYEAIDIAAKIKRKSESKIANAKT